MVKRYSMLPGRLLSMPKLKRFSQLALGLIRINL